MEQFVPLVVVVTFVVAWAWFLRERSGGRAWSPLWLAFSATALAALFLGAGTIGYILSKRDRFMAGTSWSETVLWWEVGVGVALIPLAVYFWRRGLRSISLALLLALNLHVIVQGREPRGLFVVVNEGSEVRGGCQPQSQPIPDATAVTARLRVTLSR
jgi:hypothetical protein